MQNRQNPRILPPLRGSESILHPFPKARRLALGLALIAAPQLGRAVTKTLPLNYGNFMTLGLRSAYAQRSVKRISPGQQAAAF